MAAALINNPRRSTPPRRPARTATEASLAVSPSKWGEVVSSLPVVRLSGQSSEIGSPSRDLGQPAVREPLAVPAVLSSNETPTLWSFEPKPRPKVSPAQPSASSDFWKTHEQYAIQRSRQSGRSANQSSLFEPKQRERLELARRSALEGRGQEPSALNSYLPARRVRPTESAPNSGYVNDAPSPSSPAAKDSADCGPDAYHLLQQLAKKLNLSGPPLDYLAGPSDPLVSAANGVYQQMASAAWHQAAASAALQPNQDPWRPSTPHVESAFCLTEMVEFLKRRLEAQSKQMRHLKAELNARSRLAKTLEKR